MPANPNHSKAARNQAMAAPVTVDEAAEGVKDLSVAGKGKGKPPAELSRREREAIQAQQAKERYQKLHEAGKTDEAKADLARLKLIREKREAEAARKQVGLPLLWSLSHTNKFRPRRKNEKRLRRQRRQRLMRGRRSDERPLWAPRKARERQRSREIYIRFFLFSVTIAAAFIASWHIGMSLCASHIEEYPALCRIYAICTSEIHRLP